MSTRSDHLAALIRDRRADRGWSVRKVADQARRAGHPISSSTVNNYERSEGAMPPPVSVMRGLADGLQIPYRQVLDAMYRSLGGEVEPTDPLAQFTFLSAEDREEILDVARLRNERLRRRRRTEGQTSTG